MAKRYSPAYLRAMDSGHWRALKTKANKRANHRCEHCQDASVALDLHHKHYYSLGREILADVLLLCEPCHGKADRKRRQKAKAKRKGKYKVPKRRRGQPHPLTVRWGAKAGRATTIPEYLDSDWWQQRRRQALREAEHRCQGCGATDGLEVYHRTYHRLYRETYSDLQVLCEACHEFTHAELI